MPRRHSHIAEEKDSSVKIRRVVVVVGIKGVYI